MKKKISLIFCLLAISITMIAKEYHVSAKGADTNSGTESSPFKTIGKASEMAYPGDVITVHAGTYREWVNPPRGGESNEKRIVYRAAPGEKAEIKGSEQITNWVKEKAGVWKVIIPNSFFGNYNPYTELIYGDWFNDHGRIHHTGEVFLNNKSLYEMETLDKVLNPVANPNIMDPEGSKYTWYCETDQQNTTIWANFHQYNPNKELVEISVRHTCFYPEQQGVNYLTLSGFHVSQAATQWGAPTAEQIGMIATHWNKGWIIENNVISNSKCSGITLGKERSTGHNVWLNDMTIDGSLHYIEVTFNTLRHGWNKENIGSHIIRNNVISNCEQTGICGSMGSAFSIIENNHIYDICTKRQFSGAEIAGIKFHAAIDTQIRKNRIHNTGRAIWLDWMSQGTRVTKNLLYNNDWEDIFVEVNHGPFLIDNNILASRVNLLDMSQGGAYIHNLFAGRINFWPEVNRYTPYHLPHSTEVAGLSIIPGGDSRFYNNLFTPVFPDGSEEHLANYGLSVYDKAHYPMFVQGNAYLNKASVSTHETKNLITTNHDAQLKIEDRGKEVFLSITLPEWEQSPCEIVSTEILGKAKLPRAAYEQPDGSPIVFDSDYLNNKRNIKMIPGPFEFVGNGKFSFKVW